MPSLPVDRQARRKAATRERIIDAANALFERKGYGATSIVEISRAADVAVRTIYLHFGSKAAILLAYFDDWLDDLVDRLSDRPVGEPLDVMVTTVLADMAKSGWDDDRTFAEMEIPHPLLEALAGGSIEIAGHVMHSWVRAQSTLTERFRMREGLDAASLRPRAMAAAVFATWMAAVLVYQDAFEGKASIDLRSHQTAEVVIRSFTRGIDSTP